MKKCFSVAMLITGSIVGAGFATGRELVSFFGNKIPLLTALSCGVLIFIFSTVLLIIGSKVRSDKISEVNHAIAGKAHIFLDIFMLVNNFIVLSGMLAAIDSLGNMFIKVSPLFSIVTGLLCVAVVIKGIKGVISCNRIIMPIIIVVLIWICFNNFSSDGLNGGSFNGTLIYSTFIYICMNMMLAGSVLTTVKGLTLKDILLSSAVASIILGGLIFLIINIINGSGFASYDMPILALAMQISPIVFGLIAVIVAIAIFTTMLAAMSGLVSWFEPVFSSKFFSAIIVFFGAMILSNFGFSNLVSYFYPIIGLLGLCYCLFGIIFVFKRSRLLKPLKALFKSKNTQIHDSRKPAKNKC